MQRETPPGQPDGITVAPVGSVPAFDVRGTLTRDVPGVLVCMAVAAAAMALQRLEVALVGRAWLEALVLAILLGAALRVAWTPGPRLLPGIAFSARILLEIAVLLLGSTVGAGAILAAGPMLLAGIVGIVILAIVSSYGIGRLFGLPPRMATLIACGNAICGNSAIAAVAPVIGAEAGDVAAAISFTAVLGVVVVLVLPLLAHLLHMTPHGFGILAGLTVYAVPQVLAATAPVSSLSAQIGTLVKLVRVLMLGPVVMALSLLMRGRRPPAAGTASIGLLVPWFIVGFLVLLAARSVGVIPAALLHPAALVAGWLTIVAMAALGLGVDVRALARTGFRVTAVVTLSLLALGGAAFLLVVALHPCAGG